MYKDFYPYIPGSIDARRRMRKRRIKRLYYGFGAFIVFSSGFLSGLAWYEPDPVPSQTVLPYRQLEAARTPLVKTLTPSAELGMPHVAPQPIPPSEPALHAALDTDTDETLAEADASPLSSVVLGSDTTAPPSRQRDQVPVDNMHAEAVSQSNPPKPQKQAPPPRPYLVQIGVFRNEANARNIVAKLRGKGYQPFIRRVQGRRNRVLHHVFLDRARDKAQAQATARAFEETEKMDALVMFSENLSPPNRREAESR
jgi:cell division septation protein DedD